MTEVLIVAGLVVYWLGHSFFFPWTRCSWCKGKTQHRSRNSWNIYCFACHGSGTRRRIGAKILGRGFGNR